MGMKTRSIISRTPCPRYAWYRKSTKNAVHAAKTDLDAGCHSSSNALSRALKNGNRSVSASGRLMDIPNTLSRRQHAAELYGLVRCGNMITRRLIKGGDGVSNG